MYRNIHSSNIHNSEKLSPSIRELTNKLWYIHTGKHYIAYKRVNHCYLEHYG